MRLNEGENVFRAINLTWKIIKREKHYSLENSRYLCFSEAFLNISKLYIYIYIYININKCFELSFYIHLLYIY